MAFSNFLQAVGDQWQTLLITSAVLLVLWGIFHSQKQRARYGNLPGPMPLPFLGNVVDTIRYKGQIHLQIDEYYKKYGNVFTMRFFGPYQCLVVGDVEILKDIFVKEFDYFSERPVELARDTMVFALEAWATCDIIPQEGMWRSAYTLDENFMRLPEPLASMMTIAERDKWKRIRNTLTPAFSALKMKQMIPLMNECCNILMRKLSEVADKQQSVNFVNLQNALTMDIITSAAFGLQANSQDNPDDAVIKAARSALNRSTFQKILLFALSILPFGMKILEKFPGVWLSNFTPLIQMAEDIVTVKRSGGGESSREMAEDIVAVKRSGDGESSRKDMLDMMLAAADDPSLPDHKKLSDMEVIAQSLVFLIAGFETSSATLSLACHHIATHPEVQDKLQQEVDSVWSDDEQMPTYETVNELPYLDMVISETLRLYPPGFIIQRVCTDSCVIKGIKVPKDSVVFVPVYSVHRDPAIFPNPEKFDPDRFTHTAKQSRNPYTFMPFGHGPRNCIGLRFAQMQMKLILARILKKYQLEVAPDTKIPPDVKVRGLLSCSDVNLRVAARIKTT